MLRVRRRRTFHKLSAGTARSASKSVGDRRCGVPCTTMHYRISSSSSPCASLRTRFREEATHISRIQPQIKAQSNETSPITSTSIGLSDSNGPLEIQQKKKNSTTNEEWSSEGKPSITDDDDGVDSDDLMAIVCGLIGAAAFRLCLSPSIAARPGALEPQSPVAVRCPSIAESKFECGANCLNINPSEVPQSASDAHPVANVPLVGHGSSESTASIGGQVTGGSRKFRFAVFAFQVQWPVRGV